MGLYGETLQLDSAWQVLLRVPHLQTEAKLVLAVKHIPTERPVFVIGWQGWNGRRADRSETLRWIKTLRWAPAESSKDGVATQAMAEEAFYVDLDNGPKKFRASTKHPNYQTGRFMKWWNAEIEPHDRRVTLRYVERMAAKLFAERAIEIRPGKRRPHVKRKERAVCLPFDKAGTTSMVRAIMWMPLLKQYRSLVKTWCPPEYVGDVLELASKHMGLSRRELRKKLTQFGVKVT